MTETTTQPVDTFRRATDAEIATAKAWVAANSVIDPPVWDDEAQAEYEHVLEILIFANGGRVGSRPSMTADAFEAGRRAPAESYCGCPIGSVTTIHHTDECEARGRTPKPDYTAA